MNDKVFIDTNLLIYFISQPTEKQQIVAQKLSQYEKCFISVQVLNEFINTCFKKQLLSKDDIETTINSFIEAFNLILIDVDTIKEALRISMDIHIMTALLFLLHCK